MQISQSIPLRKNKSNKQEGEEENDNDNEERDKKHGKEGTRCCRGREVDEGETCHDSWNHSGCARHSFTFPFLISCNRERKKDRQHTIQGRGT